MTTHDTLDSVYSDIHKAMGIINGLRNAWYSMTSEERSKWAESILDGNHTIMDMAESVMIGR